MNRVLQHLGKHLATKHEAIEDRENIQHSLVTWARQHPLAFFTRLLVCITIGVSTFFALFWLFYLAPQAVERGVGVIALIAIGFGAYWWAVGILFRVESPV